MADFDWLKPDYAPVYARRKARLDALRKDGRWDLVNVYYRTRPADFIQDWLFTYDPRNVNMGRPAYMPFLLFEKQREFIDWLHQCFTGGENGLVEKSRDMGVSWLCCAYALWLWRFHSGASIGFGSQKLDYVDQLGQPKSLLEKVRIMLRMLPKELRPRGYVEEKHARYLRLMNPETGSIIGGEGGDNIGRGDRTSLYFVDEAAFLEHPEAVDASLSNTTNVRVDVSTPNGNANTFYRKKVSGAVRIFTFHWTQDPRKTQAWYEDQKAKLDPETLAREVDLDYEASGGEVIISPRWVQASLALRKHLVEAGALPAKGEGIGGLDVGAGVARSVFVARHGALVSRTKSWSENDTINTAGRAAQYAREANCPRLKYDVVGVGQGVLASFKRMKGDGVTAEPINVGNTATDRTWPDRKTSREKFTNLRAETWWLVRERFRRTFEHWQALNGREGQTYPLDELILLPPDDGDLAAQLTLPRYGYTETGKIQVETKKQMKGRGVASPDSADALVLTFTPKAQRPRFGRAVGMT